MKKILMIILIVLVALAVLVILARIFMRQPDISLDGVYNPIAISSPAFADGGDIPVQYTGYGDDISPQLDISGLSDEAVSLVVIMDDIDHPLATVYNHWLIWNIPPAITIPEGISHGAMVAELDGAMQGQAYGRQRYRGPKPPFGSHRYKYNVFALDTMLELDSSANKKALLEAMDGHILQYGYIVGKYSR